MPLNIRCRSIIYNQKGPIILGTTHMGVRHKYKALLAAPLAPISLLFHKNPHPKPYHLRSVQWPFFGIP